MDTLQSVVAGDLIPGIEPHYGIDVVARTLHITPAWARRLVLRGQLRAIKPGRDYLVPLSELQRIMTMPISSPRK